MGYLKLAFLPTNASSGTLPLMAIIPLPGPWVSALVVDDFGVKYIDKANADHLVATIKSLYTITSNLEPSTVL